MKRPFHPRHRAVTAAALLLLAGALGSPVAVPAAPSGAAFELQLNGVRNARGQVVGTVCRAGERFPDSCRSAVAKAPASAGSVLLRFDGLAPGRYAVAVFHDEDGNGRLALSARGWPSEGFAFSNDAIGRSGVPDFQAASFELRPGQRQSATMRYMR
jgi:uncharacterized protein (DUF2141 family)